MVFFRTERLISPAYIYLVKVILNYTTVGSYLPIALEFLAALSRFNWPETFRSEKRSEHIVSKEGLFPGPKSRAQRYQNFLLLPLD